MENKYGLTFPQKNIWLVEEFFGKSPINTIVGIFEVNKEFEFEICEKAINKMVEVNDALRLKVFKENDEVYQCIDKYNYFKVDYFDMVNEDEERVKALEKRLTTKPFEVLENPLYYFAVVRTGEDNGYIFVKLHHLVSDAWTFGNVATQLAEYIDMFTNDENQEVVKPSYVDFIEAEKEYISSEKFNKDKMFWEEYLSGIEESVGLKENSDKTLIDAKRYTVKLDEKLNNEIKEFCKANRVSPYTIFMNALAIYLHRVTEKYDFVIGTPVLNRSNFKEKNMMGMFVSTMPVRFKIDEKETFLEMCKKSASETMSLFRHQKYPYSLMLKDFRENNNVSTNLYEVMISYQNARAEYSDNEKYSTDWMFSTKVQDQFAIHIMDMDETGVLEVHFDYLIDLFEDVEIEYIAKRLFTIIQDGIENNKTIETIEIMPEEEKNKILYEFNDTKRDYPKDKTVIEIFEEQVEKTPNNIALVFEGEKLTYKELDEKANSLANYLLKVGISANDNIGIMQNKGINIVVTILALLKIGAVYVPMDVNATLISKRHIIENARIKLIISDIERANIDNTKIIDVTDIPVDNTKISFRSNSTDVINIMYTSGTTGRPKGVMITNRNIIKLVKNSNYISFFENDIMLQTGSYTFDASTLELWNALLNGIELHMVKNELLDPEGFKKYIINNKVTIIFLTTAIFNQMISYDTTMFKSVRLLMTGGEAMSKEHAKKVKSECPRIILENLYGPTENAVVSTSYCVKGDETIIPIGQPISNTTCYVLDNKLRLVPLNVEGTLYVGGEGVAKGYINNEKLTNEKFVNNVYEKNKIYNTGDVVKLTNEGNILFLGRKDSEVKIKGIRVNIDEIKNKVNNFGEIQNSEVLYIEDDKESKYLGLAFISKRKEDVQELKKYLKNFLPIAIIPRKIIQLEKMPLTQNAKVDRKKLHELFKNTILRTTKEINYDGVYLTIYNLFKDVLDINYIELDDDFFELGGDSILGVKLITQAIKQDINITYNDLYKYRTIRELGDMLQSGNDNKLISEDIDKYDYTRINKLLNKGSILEDSNNEVGNVILAGATGFLGMHILGEFISSNKGKVYCLVRKSSVSSAEERLKERLHYYFGNTYDKYFGNRIFVVEYDGELTREVLNKIKIENVTHLVNSLALVKHYGDIEEFYNVNVRSVELMCEFCVKNNIELMHISTLSVSGDIVETAKGFSQNDINKRKYTELNLYLNQTLDNVYAYTKFIAERVILEQILDNGLKARILRMGNLSDRISDNKFQINERDNAFSMRLKSLITLGIIPEETRKHGLDFTPVDIAAEAIVLLLKVNEKTIIYHLYNNNKVIIERIVEMLNNNGVSIKFGNSELVSKTIHSIINKKQDNNLNGILVDITKESDLKYVTDIDIDNSLTTEILNKYGFEWPEISDKYLLKLLNRIIKL